MKGIRSGTIPLELQDTGRQDCYDEEGDFDAVASQAKAKEEFLEAIKLLDWDEIDGDLEDW